jgi:hypothetical protein
MKVKLSNTKMTFGDQLQIDAGIKVGDFMFVFKIKDADEFGFHKADKEQAKAMVCSKVKEDRSTGLLYIQPTDPPVGFINALMRNDTQLRKQLRVEKLDMDGVSIYIIKKD